MDLKQAQELIERAVENPAVPVPADELALAAATVIVRGGLIGLPLSTTTLTVVTTGVQP